MSGCILAILNKFPLQENLRVRQVWFNFFETAFTRIDVLEQTIFSFEASGDKVLVVGYEHMQVKDTGKEYQSNWIHMYTLAAGQVIAFEEFIDTAGPGFRIQFRSGTISLRHH